MALNIIRQDASGTIYILTGAFYPGKDDTYIFSNTIEAAFAETPDGASYAIDASRNFRYRDGVVTPTSLSESIPVNSVWYTVNKVTNNKNYNLAVINRFQAGQDIAINDVNVNSLSDNGTLVLVNIGKRFGVQVTPITNFRESPTIYSLDTGDIIAFVDVDTTLTNYSYSVVGGSDELAAMTLVMAIPTDQASTNSGVAGPVIVPEEPVEPLISRRRTSLAGLGSSGSGSSSRSLATKPIPKMLNLPAAESVVQPLTPFERAKVLQIRAKQIADNYPVFIDPQELIDPIMIARAEFATARVDPLVRQQFDFIMINRYNPDHQVNPELPERIEIPLSELLTTWKE